MSTTATPNNERSPTPFQQKVYGLLETIPSGKVATYASLGHALGCRSAQAIGQALKRNPYAPDVPCHRIIRTDLTIGGYSGETAGPKLQKKLRLLANEGVLFDSTGKLTEPERLYEF